ncbi:nitrilase-related carbon-nitrogen hydrolase [Natrononativus amylolyticus]|uniref:nitrilase-related carbon-nitrogen hydrolase n=1 Tax=Natrononativus amylolyticus TaxID=2963434 RepID=UPI0020CE1F3C|nr:nitrilase-related carbon-nitrogen hydrolase [Natrononativus amylolyticus]
MTRTSSLRRECAVLAVTAAWRTAFFDWRLLGRARAHAGRYYVVAANHAGDQPGRHHANHSLVAGPDGQIRAETEWSAAAASACVAVDDLECERNPVRQTRLSRGDWRRDEGAQSEHDSHDGNRM